MGHVQETPVTGGPLQALMVAWTLVVGLAFAPVFVYANQTKNYELLIAFLGAALVIGASLFVALVLARAGAHAKRRSTEPIANLTHRGGLFGRR